MERTIEILTFDQVLEINRRFQNSGDCLFVGRDNLRNEDALHYILYAITNPFFGEDLYPTLFDKAAALGWQINTHHVFVDGNKRTSFAAAQLMLNLNAYTIPASPKRVDTEKVNMALGMARSEISARQFSTWLKDRAYPIA